MGGGGALGGGQFRQFLFFSIELFMFIYHKFGCTWLHFIAFYIKITQKHSNITVFIHLVHWNHRNLSFSEIGLFFNCFQNTTISLVLFLIFLVPFGRRSQKKEFGYWNISILWDFCRGYLVKISFFGIFFLISHYFTGFGYIQHLFLKIQVILPRFRGGEVQANHKKQHFLCVKVVILGVQKMA